MLVGLAPPRLTGTGGGVPSTTIVRPADGSPLLPALSNAATV